MSAQPVEWVLVVRYVREVHRQTYGRRVRSNKYTKDYIQLSRRREFLDAVSSVFPGAAGPAGAVPLVYRWPLGATPGSFVFNSSDRPHLKWETSLGAPEVWKMNPSPTDAGVETIPGDPTHVDFDAAEAEYDQLESVGAGQPFLVAVKLRDEPTTLHLRTYLAHPSAMYQWANLNLLPSEIQDLANETTERRAIAQSSFQSGGTAPSAPVEAALDGFHSYADAADVLEELDAMTARGLSEYLRRPGFGLFFDPTQNHDSWSRALPISEDVALSAPALIDLLDARFPAINESDVAAEQASADPAEVEAFREQIVEGEYTVADSTATVKTRGSAQRAFADAVKSNYGGRCAVTGITTKDFLVASHIVPWSADASIRLDPSNGICLSLLVDKAFEKGFLLIEDDLTVRIDIERAGKDDSLLSQLTPFDGAKLSAPLQQPPHPEYLRRRREMVSST